MTFNSITEIHKTDAYLALLERHKGILYKVARSYATDHEVDDLVQDICLQLWRSFERYDERFAEST
ncbi:MAG TPA: sigma factor, partial [Saprospiraceae bacterium]|nr:sigma factor [Saprospiraceae bacterium]